MKKLFFNLFITISLLSCREDLDLYEQSLKYCKENIEFTCTEPHGEFFFKGKLNGKDFCVSKGVNDYWVLNDIGTETVTLTSNPVLSPDVTPQSSYFNFGFYPPIMDNWNGILEEFAPSVYIYTPSVLDTTVLKASKYIDKFIQEGNLKLRDKNTDKYSGFHFVISWGCVMLPGYEYYLEKDPTRIPVVGEGITPSTGVQKNSVFRVTSFEKKVTPDFIIYDITFEISCDLYYGSDSTDNGYFGRLEDGVFKTQVILSRTG